MSDDERLVAVTQHNETDAATLTRRAFLKTGAAAAGAAVGSGAITGFPTIWAQEIKDIELRHVGVSYSVVKAIGDQASKDLGFKVSMQNLDTSAASCGGSATPPISRRAGSRPPASPDASGRGAASTRAPRCACIPPARSPC